MPMRARPDILNWTASGSKVGVAYGAGPAGDVPMWVRPDTLAGMASGPIVAWHYEAGLRRCSVKQLYYP